MGPTRDSPSYNLPDPSLRDDPRLIEPALAVELDDEEVADLTSSHSPFAIAATISGPTHDKASNQDFSLVAAIRGPANQPWAFAAVADGVTTKTFWPARAARISALVAFKVARRAVRRNRSFDDNQLHQMRNDLADALLAALARDRANLKRELDLHPAGWRPELYRENIDNDTYWYNSTLLVACLGPTHGFALWAGDGGISILKTARIGAPATETVPLFSTEDLAIGTFVSLAVSASQFRAATISYPPPPGTVAVCLASDGVDRTLQREQLDYPGLCANLRGPQHARQRLEDLAQRPGREIDDYSLAWIVGPPPPSFEWRQVEASRDSTGRNSIEKVPAAPAAPPNTVPPGSPSARVEPPPHVEPPSPAQAPPSLPSTPRPKVRLSTAISLGVAFLLGFLANVVVSHLRAAPPRPPAPPAHRAAEPSGPAVVAAPPPRAVAKPLAPPATGQQMTTPIPITAADAAALKLGTLTPEMRDQMQAWVRYLKLQPPGKPHAIVVFATRESLQDRKNCQANAKVSAARAETIVRRLTEMIGPTEPAGKVSLSGYGNACSPPPGIADPRSAAARLVVLTEVVPACDCEKEPLRAGKASSSIGAPLASHGRQQEVRQP